MGIGCRPVPSTGSMDPCSCMDVIKGDFLSPSYPLSVFFLHFIRASLIALIFYVFQLNGSVKEPNKFYNYETEKIARKASDTAEYIELFGSSTRDHHARRI